MYTKKDREQILSLYDKSLEAVLSNDELEVNKANPSEILEKSIEEGRTTEGLRLYLTSSVATVVRSCVPVGAPLPEYQIRVGASQSEVSGAWRIDLLIRPVKASSLKKFSYAYKGLVDEVTAEELIRYVGIAFRDIIDQLMAAENLDRVNEVFAEATAAENANTRYGVSFVLREESDSTSFISNISDDEIVFAVFRDAAFEVPEYSLFAHKEDLNELDPELLEVGDLALITLRNERIENSFASLVNSLTSAETVVDLLSLRLKLIKSLTGIGTHNPAVLIRKAFSKKIEGVSSRTKKPIVARVETDEVIGAVEHDGGAGVTIVHLSPVDRKTLEPVDFDLVEYAQSVLR